VTDSGEWSYTVSTSLTGILVGGPHAGSTPEIGLTVFEIVNDRTGAIYTRGDGGQYVFAGYADGKVTL
jgi:hypothetical protein